MAAEPPGDGCGRPAELPRSHDAGAVAGSTRRETRVRQEHANNRPSLRSIRLSPNLLGQSEPVKGFKCRPPPQGAAMVRSGPGTERQSPRNDRPWSVASMGVERE
jgi:hypothetical protein